MRSCCCTANMLKAGPAKERTNERTRRILIPPGGSIGLTIVLCVAGLKSSMVRCWRNSSRCRRKCLTFYNTLLKENISVADILKINVAMRQTD